MVLGVYLVPETEPQGPPQEPAGLIDVTGACRVLMNPLTGELLLGCPPAAVDDLCQRAHRAGRAQAGGTEAPAG